MTEKLKYSGRWNTSLTLPKPPTNFHLIQFLLVTDKDASDIAQQYPHVQNLGAYTATKPRRKRKRLLSITDQTDDVPAPDEQPPSRADPAVRTPTIPSLPTPAISSVSDTETDRDDTLPSLPPDEELTEDYVPDADMEEALLSTAFPTPPTHDA